MSLEVSRVHWQLKPSLFLRLQKLLGIVSNDSQSGITGIFHQLIADQARLYLVTKICDRITESHMHRQPASLKGDFSLTYWDILATSVEFKCHSRFMQESQAEHRKWKGGKAEEKGLCTRRSRPLKIDHLIDSRNLKDVMAYCSDMTDQYPTSTDLKCYGAFCWRLGLEVMFGESHVSILNVRFHWPMCDQCLQIAAFTLLQSVLIVTIESFLCCALTSLRAIITKGLEHLYFCTSRPRLPFVQLT